MLYLTNLFHYNKKALITSWSVIALGALVTLAGVSMTESDEKIKAGVTGFGIAHILLGALDLFRLANQKHY